MATIGISVCAIGQQTTSTLQDYGYSADYIPSSLTSLSFVEELSDDVADQCVEIAYSAHGNDVLVQGLEAAGAIVHEMHLYYLDKPSSADHSVTLIGIGTIGTSVGFPIAIALVTSFVALQSILVLLD